MLKGVIRTADILRHPIITIRVLGFLGFLRVVGKCFSPASYFFVNLLIK